MQSNSQITEAWDSLVAVALLGTERRTASLPSLGGTLGALLSQLSDGAKAEQAFLGASALLAAYTRVGRQPVMSKSPQPSPCEPEEHPYCTQRAAGHLALMLGGQHDDVLPEWLQALGRRGMLVPPEHVSALLDLGASRSHLRDAIRLVAGKRGRWLARQNPQWEYLAPLEADRDSWEAKWETANFGARRAMLEQVRRVDPARARELITTSWKEDKASERAAFIATLRTGLSPEDEPLLETALDDRSKDVREEAAELLSQLPGSGLVRRAIEAVLPLVSFKELRQRRLLGGVNDKSYIEVALPQDYTPQMKRDAVQQKSPYTRLGERAYWLSQLLGRIPLGYWSERWRQTPGAIIAATANTKEWRDMLMGAWTGATWRHKDAEWARALLAHSQANTVEGAIQNLLPVLPASEREQFVLGALKRNPAALYTAAMPVSLLWQCESPWSTELSRTVLRSVSHYIVTTSAYGGWEVRQSLQGIARSVSPSILEEATAVLSERASANPFFADAVDEFLATVQFRRDMLKELD